MGKDEEVSRHIKELRNRKRGKVIPYKSWIKNEELTDEQKQAVLNAAKRIVGNPNQIDENETEVELTEDELARREKKKQDFVENVVKTWK